MKRTLVFQILLGAAAPYLAVAIEAPTGLVSRTGDKSIVLHWNQNTEANLAGYRVYRSTSSSGPFVAQNPSVVMSAGFCDLTVGVVNGQTNYYRVTALTSTPPDVRSSSTNAPLSRWLRSAYGSNAGRCASTSRSSSAVRLPRPTSS